MGGKEFIKEINLEKFTQIINVKPQFKMGFIFIHWSIQYFLMYNVIIFIKCVCSRS